MTAVQQTLEVEHDRPATSVGDVKSRAKFDALALQQLLAPVKGAMAKAQRIQLIASAATVVPFVGIVELGRALLVDGPVNATRVWTIVAIVVAALLVRTLASGAALTITHFADVDLQRALRRRIVDTLGRLPLGWFNSTSSGEVRKAVQNDVGELHFLVAHSAVENAGALATPVFGLAYCFYLDWRLGLLALATLPVYIAIFAWLGRDSRAQMERLDRGIERISATIVEFIAGVSVGKTFGEAGKAHKRFADAADEFNDSFATWMEPMVRVKPVSAIFIETPVLLLANLAGGYSFVRSGWVTPIDVLGSTLVAVTVPAAVLTVGYSTHFRRQAQAAAGRLQRLLQAPKLSAVKNPQVPQGNSVEFDAVGFSYDGQRTVLDDVSLCLAPGTITPGRVELDHVAFSYPGRKVLFDVSFTAEPGTMTALVGPSRSGKTTVTRLVARFYDVDGGVVRVGGVDVRDQARADLMAQVSLVFQDVYLFDDTLWENIRIGRPDAGDADIEDAARTAGLFSVVERLPDGWQTRAGEGGSALSGGERQRVSIARALIKNAPIVLFDEATSALDPENEDHVADSIRRLAHGSTVIVIAHKLSTVTAADNIVVLSADGTVQDSGTHADLITRGGQYAEFWSQRASATGWSMAGSAT